MADPLSGSIGRSTDVSEGRPIRPATPRVTERPPVSVRIAELAREIAAAGERLAETRQAFGYAGQAKSEAEALFSNVASQLMAAIQEHREGTPEGVPYERER